MQHATPNGGSEEPWKARTQKRTGKPKTFRAQNSTWARHGQAAPLRAAGEGLETQGQELSSSTGNEAQSELQPRIYLPRSTPRKRQRNKLLPQRVQEKIPGNSAALHLMAEETPAESAWRRQRCSFKIDGRCGTVEEDQDLQRCILHGRRSTRDICIRDVRRSGCWFPERGCILEHQIFRFANIILRDMCSTSYDLASLFPGRRSTLDRWTEKIAKRIGTSPCFALYFPFLREVSQNCFVFSVVKVKNWRRLAEFLRFGGAKFHFERTFRRTAAFWACQLPLLKEVPHNCFLSDRKKHR